MYGGLLSMSFMVYKNVLNLYPFHRKKGETMATAYLVIYNLAQTLGWSYIMVAGALAYCESPTKIYSAVELPLQVFQTLAVLEVVHALLGVVRSNVFVTAFQVASRVFLVWPILAVFAESQSSVGFPMLLAAWTITEIIRYGCVNMSWDILNSSCLDDIFLVDDMQLLWTSKFKNKFLFESTLTPQILRRQSSGYPGLSPRLSAIHVIYRTIPLGCDRRVIVRLPSGVEVR